jgi:hypothetical protein
MKIEKTSYSEIEKLSGFTDLLDEYAVESAIHGLPHPKCKAEQYRILDKSGIFHVFAAFYGDKLIGFISILIPTLNHYSKVVAVGESYFVAKNFRHTGAGTALRLTAEEFAGKSKAFGLLLSAPSGSALDKILPHSGYKETNRVYFKAFPHE